MTEALAPAVDFLIPADRVEVVNGKLYMMGGCWDRIQVPTFPVLYPIAFAIRVSLPSEDTREDHTIELRVDGPPDADIQPSVVQFIRQSVAVQTPRVFVLFAIGGLLRIVEPGIYTVFATVDGANGLQSEFVVESDPTQPA